MCVCVTQRRPKLDRKAPHKSALSRINALPGSRRGGGNVHRFACNEHGTHPRTLIHAKSIRYTLQPRKSIRRSRTYLYIILYIKFARRRLPHTRDRPPYRAHHPATMTTTMHPYRYVIALPIYTFCLPYKFFAKECNIRISGASSRFSRPGEINIGFRQTRDTPSIRVSIEQYLFSRYRFCCTILAFSTSAIGFYRLACSFRFSPPPVNAVAHPPPPIADPTVISEVIEGYNILGTVRS